jgi:hypothetical protein
MIPKALHILGGLAVSLILRCIFYCFGWERGATATARRRYGVREREESDRVGKLLKAWGRDGERGRSDPGARY